MRTFMLCCAAASFFLDSVRAETPVDLELILAVDISLSMTPGELEIQRRGYAEALVSEDVVEAIRFGVPHGQIALTYVEWAGPNSQRVIVDWTLIRTRTDAEAFAARLTTAFPDALPRTAISSIIDHSIPRFQANGFLGERLVIDISGDGPNNGGRPVLAARADAVARGITINGLPLMTQEGSWPQFNLDDLDEYYRQCVIAGPTAFAIPVLRWQDFPEAVRRKLVLELSGARPAEFQVTQVDGYDCLIGEKIWEQFFGDWN
ncbi:MAG: DUF1194 domain-containing protein [Pseudomonadota bacterium]